MKYTNRADLLIAAGESIKMQEKTGIEPVVKIAGQLDKCNIAHFDSSCFGYEFPLAVVEGKPVFVGDELWAKSGYAIFAESGVNFDHCSWNPPKPKTVMVEYTIDEAKRVVTALEQYKVPVAAESALVATRKALEESK